VLGYMIFGTIFYRLFRQSLCREMLVAFRAQFPTAEPIDVGLLWLTKKYAYFTIAYRISKSIPEHDQRHVLVYSRIRNRVMRSREHLDILFER